jgi:hypothetical protein
MNDTSPSVDPDRRPTPSGWNQFRKAVAKGFFLGGCVGLGITAGPLVVAALGGITTGASSSDARFLLYPIMPLITLLKALNVPYTTAGLVIYLVSPILGYGLIGVIFGCLYWCATRRK